MLKINNISNVGEHILVEFSEEKSAIFHKFGDKGDIYTTVSDELNKATVSELKESIKKNDWNLEKIKKEWL